MNFTLTDLLLPCVLLAIVLVVFLTEILKKADKKNILKGKKVFFPLTLSLVFSGLLALGKFYTLLQAPFYAAVIFTLSVTFFETILKKFNLEKSNETGSEAGT